MKTIELHEKSGIGLHIRKKRVDQEMLQKEVAELIGVSEDSITYWEGGRAYPQIQHFPKIILFLGYNPVKISDGTLGGRIQNYRITHGMSHKAFGKLIGVNASTIGAWESEKSKPALTHLKRLNKVLDL